ncbi:MAG: family 10 glycosylhydrolase [Bacteroidota bacterium]
MQQYIDSPKREVRGAWIATVANIDYPKKPTSNSVAQREQWNKLVERLKKNGINTLFVQVRPAADALYASEFVPWSHFLNGKQGTPPVPAYDPMEYMIEVAHRNGMEFHAWLNPYRATFNLDTLSLSSWHVFNKHRDWVVQYGSKMYLNPGVPDVRKHVVRVVEEIVEQYNIDGIHMDDYFYPYPIKNVPFPDSIEYAQYGEPYGSLEDWRRNNIDQLIEALAVTVKAKKPYLLFGISPFGVWRNKADDPLGSDTRAGARSYDDLYADILKWLQKGWIDYVAPQLYFNIGLEVADYEILLNWWRIHNYDRKLIIGQAAYKVGNNPVEAWLDGGEIPKQIMLNRRYDEVAGSIFFSAKSLINNSLGVADSLSKNFYKDRALTAFDFPGEMTPEPPRLLKVKGTPEGVKVKWRLNEAAATNGFGLLPPDYYVVYRFPQGVPIDKSDASNIVFISDLDGKYNCLIDKTTTNGEVYTYAIAAVNRFRNESSLSNMISVRKELGKVKRLKGKKIKRKKKQASELEQPTNTSF